ncbi:MAG: STAS domain-containing protein [Bacteroidota bacterium]|nr:STAS domain-containing protein [Candidatus Kapabacteria bacterium]MDW8218999.1 STAS domain-containing protein [Bacteroidota bacterium]
MYKLEISTHEHAGIGIVSLVGEIDAATAPILEMELIPLAQQYNRLILDLSAVRSISSIGLRKILMLYRTIKIHNGQILLAGMSESLRNIMWASGFLNYFIVAESLEMGIAAFE